MRKFYARRDNLLATRTIGATARWQEDIRSRNAARATIEVMRDCAVENEIAIRKILARAKIAATI